MPGEQFAVVPKAAELMIAIFDEDQSNDMAALPKELVASITALRSHLERLGVMHDGEDLRTSLTGFSSGLLHGEF